MSDGFKDVSDTNIIKNTESREVLTVEKPEHFDGLSAYLKNNALVTLWDETKNSNENPIIMNGKVNNEELSIDSLSGFRKSYPFPRESGLDHNYDVVGPWKNEWYDIFENEPEEFEGEMMYMEFESGTWNIMKEEIEEEERDKCFGNNDYKINNNSDLKLHYIVDIL